MTLWIKIIVLGIGPAMPRFNILVNLYTYKGQQSFLTGVTGLNVVTSGFLWTQDKVIGSCPQWEAKEPQGH